MIKIKKSMPKTVVIDKKENGLKNFLTVCGGVNNS